MPERLDLQVESGKPLLAQTGGTKAKGDGLWLFPLSHVLTSLLPPPSSFFPPPTLSPMGFRGLSLGESQGDVRFQVTESGRQPTDRPTHSFSLALPC